MTASQSNSDFSADALVGGANSAADANARRLSVRYVKPKNKHRRKEEFAKLSKEEKRKRRGEISQTFWATEQDEVESDVSLDERWQLIQRYGDFSMAYSTLVQPRLQYFGDADGYIAFGRRWGFNFALADPVTAAERQLDLIKRFVIDHDGPSFCQVSEPIAHYLADLGYRVNEIGVDTTLHLPDYTFGGKEKEWLRYAANWTARRGYKICECTYEEVGVNEVEEISEAWRATRTVKHKEVRFLNRPIEMIEEPDVRKFFLFSPEGKVLAFVFLDPLYRDAQIEGYVTVIKRRHPDAPLYAEHAIMKSIIQTLKDEGVLKLKLGLSPMAWIEDEQFTPSWVVGQMFKRCFRSRLINRRFYNLQGHADYKRRFRGTEEKVYYAAPPRWSMTRLAALVGLCGIA